MDLLPILASVALGVMGLTMAHKWQKAVVGVLGVLVIFGQVNDFLETQQQRLEIERVGEELRQTREQMLRAQEYARGQADMLGKLSAKTLEAVVEQRPADLKTRAAEVSTALIALAADCKSKSMEIINRPNTNHEDWVAMGDAAARASQECLARYSRQYAAKTLAIYNELVDAGVDVQAHQTGMPIDAMIRVPTNYMGLEFLGVAIGAAAEGLARTNGSASPTVTASPEAR